MMIRTLRIKLKLFKCRCRFLLIYAVIAALPGAVPAAAEPAYYTAAQLWQVLTAARLVGAAALQSKPYPGRLPHGAVLQRFDARIDAGSAFDRSWCCATTAVRNSACRPSLSSRSDFLIRSALWRDALVAVLSATTGSGLSIPLTVNRCSLPTRKGDSWPAGLGKMISPLPAAVLVATAALVLATYCSFVRELRLSVGDDNSAGARTMLWRL